ncbi:UvrD-helicase domain-containing protein [Pseudomonas sp. R32]|uniref:UvrD-helicase domain-containing protein n=1 Tax=Pseudomonas sp. R32 TaxID=1573704 RepID=UPI001331A6EB|nr:ATP-dependent helicase [Pseudomonas sp. R32]
MKLDLDVEQKEVVEAPPSQWMLVNAGPGTGKTQVSALRLVHLLHHGLNPGQILVLSFSRSAVHTLSRRLERMSLLDESIAEDVRHLTIRTFDAWAFRVLRQSGSETKSLLNRSYDENIIDATSLLKDDDAEEMHSRLRSIRHVIVDEFQDLPGVRADLVLALLKRLNDGAADPVGFTVLGDPAQAIYRFSERALGNAPPEDPWLKLKRSFARGLKEIELARNYRATPLLATQTELLRSVLRNDGLDGGEKLQALRDHLESLPMKEPGTKIGPEWLTQLPDGSVAILTRTNGEAILLVQMLMGKDPGAPTTPVVLRLAGQPRSIPAWIGGLLSQLKVAKLTFTIFKAVYTSALSRLGSEGGIHLRLPTLVISWQRLLRVSGGSDTDTSIDMQSLRDRLAWPDTCQEDQLDEQEPRVFVTTIHQAKGMEFDHVALLEVRPSRNNEAEEEKESDPQEEANVSFVGITRAAQSIGRLAADCIWTPPYEYKLPSKRKRYVSRIGMINIQLGLSGDIEPNSFVSTQLLGNDEAVSEVQALLMKRGKTLCGRKIELRKKDAEIAVGLRYGIFLLEDDGSESLIGLTTKQFTLDLLDLLKKDNLRPPFKLYNLRISDVVTVTAPIRADDAIPEPWQSSRIWLGVTLSGTAAFKKIKRKGA